MFSRKKLILVLISLFIVNIQAAFAGWKDNAKAIKVSGGEDHTLVLTQNKSAWACGYNLKNMFDIRVFLCYDIVSSQ